MKILKKMFVTCMIGPGVLIVVGIVFLMLKTREVNRGCEAVLAQLQQMRYAKLSNVGAIKQLSILPLVESQAAADGLKTENGVAYLIRADDQDILFDVGFNATGEHPSPLLHNMAQLGIRLDEIDMLVLSHLHPDHIGGQTNYQKQTFSLSQGGVQMNPIPVYAPGETTPAFLDPVPAVHVLQEPRVLAPGVASIGVIPRFLFIMGYIAEQSLAFNLEGKGIVLVIGCGHPTIERILERTPMLFDEPIYAIIGGLHFPVLQAGEITVPRLIQFTVGSDAPPWNGITHDDVYQAIDTIKTVNPAFVGLSPHDSSPWSLQQFRKAFQDRYIELKVGQEITL